MAKISTPEVIGQYIDQYGDQRTIHRHKAARTIHVKHQRVTPVMAMNKVIGPEIGNRIREARIAAGMTLEELCLRAGLIANAAPKARMWEIENCIRQQSMKFGTLYAIARALGKPVESFLPTVEEVVELADVKAIFLPPTLAIVPS